MRMRILLAQAKELSGLGDDVIKTFWPMAADTAVAQQQSMALGRKFPFGSEVWFSNLYQEEGLWDGWLL